MRFFDKKRSPFFHLGLAAATFIMSMGAGAFWIGKNFFDISTWVYGLEYALLIMGFISAHEFGHYFAARYHKIDVTLPYYIPNPIPFHYVLNFGTFGALIKIRQPIPNNKVLLDIGASGPIAGFVLCIIYLVIGTLNLPGKEYIYQLHPEYLTQFAGEIPNYGLHFGDSILFFLARELLTPEAAFFPPMNEIYHYPYLTVAWFGLFVTMLNLMPMGQLDGGHILYSLFGKKHKIIATWIWRILISMGILGLIGEFAPLIINYSGSKFFETILYIPVLILKELKNTLPWILNSWSGWLFWGIIIKLFIKIEHPPILYYEKLGKGRTIIAYISLAIFILTFTFNGIYIL